MKLVIEMSEEKYKWIKENNPKADKNSIVGAIVYGTPLPKEHGWIPVSERLPEEQGLYLVTVKVGDKYCVSTDIYNSLYKKGFKMLNAIAWMPLPEPYKTDKGGEI